MAQHDTNPVSNMVEKGRIESIKRISRLSAIASWVAVVAYLFAVLPTGGDPRYYMLTVIGIILAISFTIADFLAHNNKTSPAIWISLFTTEIMFIALSLMIANQGIILAIILLIITTGLAFQSFPANKAIIAFITGVVASITTLSVDLFSLPFRIIPSDYLLSTIIIISGGLSILILGVELLRHYQFNSIHTQIIVAFLIISMVPLWTIAGTQLIATNSSLQTAAERALASSATEITNNLDTKLKYLKDTNTNDANLPVLVKFTQNGMGTPEDIFEYFKVMKKRDANILSYSLLDKNGKKLVDTQTNQVGTVNESSAMDVKKAMQNQESSISDINFDKAINKHVFYISSPISNGNLNSGVLRVEINAELLQEELKSQATNQEKAITIILIDQDGIILANSSSPETRFKSIVPLSQERLAILQQRQLLASGNAENLTVGFSDLAKGLNQNNQNPFFQATLTPDSSEIDAVTQRGVTNNKSWKIVVGQPVSSFAASANDQTRGTTFISVIIMLIVLVAAGITSNLLTSPFNYLTAMSERIRRGELDAPIKIERRDEIGKFSEVLALTTTELKNTLETLESRIVERTAGLATATENIEHHTNQLRTIVEITHAITSIQNLDELLPETSRQISIMFGFYHVGIFLTDQTGQYVILQASNSISKSKMLGHRVKVGQNSIIGFVIGSGQPRIALDVGDDATFFNNPDLPDTHSEIALPLRIGENIIGVLDLHSNETSAFDTEDIGIFSLLANQISIAIQNARLFDETRAALVEAQVFYRKSATTSWREVLRQGTRGYRYLNGSIEAIKTAGEPPKKITAVSSNPELLTIPINIRGKTLGVLNIRQTGRNHSWSRSEIHIYQSIVDRISFALENARLYQDAQRRASKERVLSEIATKVSGSVNMDNILQTAVEELGRVLPGSEIVIQFEQEDETSA
jgi:GAF domain-containing protein